MHLPQGRQGEQQIRYDCYNNNNCASRGGRAPACTAKRGGANRRQEPFAISTIMRYAATTKMRLPMVKPMKIGSQDAMSTVELMVLSTIALPRR